MQNSTNLEQMLSVERRQADQNQMDNTAPDFYV